MPQAIPSFSTLKCNTEKLRKDWGRGYEATAHRVSSCLLGWWIKIFVVWNEMVGDNVIVVNLINIPWVGMLTDKQVSCNWGKILKFSYFKLGHICCNKYPIESDIKRLMLSHNIILYLCHLQLVDDYQNVRWILLHLKTSLGQTLSFFYGCPLWNASLNVWTCGAITLARIKH